MSLCGFVRELLSVRGMLERRHHPLAVLETTMRLAVREKMTLVMGAGLVGSI